MLRAEDNRYLTDSGAGTPMGELLRRFWMPVRPSRATNSRSRQASRNRMRLILSFM